MKPAAIITMPNGCLGLVVGDVTGHGIGPALLMAETRAYLRILASHSNDVGHILTQANRVLCEDIGAERFVTMLLVMLDPATRTICHASAGHPSGLWLDAKGESKLDLRRNGIPLGLRPDTEYAASEPQQLEPGDLLALMTDGVEESLSAEDELFGNERVLATIRAGQSGPAKKNRSLVA